MCPLERRQEAWKRLASDLDAGKLAAMTSEIDLSGVLEVGRRIVGRDTRPGRGQDRVVPVNA